MPELSDFSIDALNQLARNALPEQRILGNTAAQWLIAAAVALAAVLALRVLAAMVVRRGRQWAQSRTPPWPQAVVEALRGTRFWFLLAVSLYVGSLLLVFSQSVRNLIDAVTITALLLQGALWANVLITAAVAHYVDRRRETDAGSAMTVGAIGLLCRIALWSLVVLVALANFGVDVTAMVAGLGIGGIAVALAAQNILGDLFASLSIVLDKPFVVGDFIVVGDHMGTVERVGLKTTRVRSLSGEQLVFSNNDLLQSRIRNYKRMSERRIVFTLGVTYETPHDKLAAVPAMIREIIEARETVRFDRAHFKEYGDFSLNFEIVYYVLSPDYGRFMDIQQAINLEIFKRFEQAGLVFAYPTQTVHVQREAATP